jgi:hypothetical protein
MNRQDSKGLCEELDLLRRRECIGERAGTEGGDRLQTGEQERGTKGLFE